jgi:hypothetical protein
LRPEVLEYQSFSEFPYLHIGRSQKYCSEYNRGLNICCWDARMSVIPGAPLQLTFEPVFVDSDSMYYAKRELYNVSTSGEIMDNKANKNSNGNNLTVATEEPVVDLVQASKNLFRTPHAFQSNRILPQMFQDKTGVAATTTSTSTAVASEGGTSSQPSSSSNLLGTLLEGSNSNNLISSDNKKQKRQKLLPQD